MSNDYQRGVTDTLAAMRIELGWTGLLSDRGKARALGKKLADAFLQENEGTTPDEFLGPPWSEMGKSYPRKVGLALVSKGFDPDREEPRRELLGGFHDRLRDRATEASPA